jgi:hypothetical protein
LNTENIEPVISNRPLTAAAKNIIRISRGPQFGAKGRPVLALFAMASFILSVYSLIMEEFLYSIVLLLTGIVIFSLVLNIHGIEVDTCRHTIRDYIRFLWFRIGKWRNINDYRSIYLTRENVVIRTSGYAEHASDTFHYYYIKLVDEHNNREIILAECKNYYKAQRISKNIADATGLEFKDFIKPVHKNIHEDFTESNPI